MLGKKNKVCFAECYFFIFRKQIEFSVTLVSLGCCFVVPAPKNWLELPPLPQLLRRRAAGVRKNLL